MKIRVFFGRNLPALQLLFLTTQDFFHLPDFFRRCMGRRPRGQGWFQHFAKIQEFSHRLALAC